MPIWHSAGRAYPRTLCQSGTSKRPRLCQSGTAKKNERAKPHWQGLARPFASNSDMEKFVVVRVRMKWKQYEIVQTHTEAYSESVNAFINRAIDETIERDNAAPGASERA